MQLMELLKLFELLDALTCNLILARLKVYMEIGITKPPRINKDATARHMLGTFYTKLLKLFKFDRNYSPRHVGSLYLITVFFFYCLLFMVIFLGFLATRSSLLSGYICVYLEFVFVDTDSLIFLGRLISERK